MSCDVDPYPVYSVPEEPTTTFGEYNSKAEHSYLSSSTVCSSSLASYTTIRLLCCNTYYKTEFHPKDTHKLTLHTKTREERCASYASAFIGDNMAHQLSGKQRRIPYSYKDSNSVERCLRPATHAHGYTWIAQYCGHWARWKYRPATDKADRYPWNRWLPAREKGF